MISTGARLVALALAATGAFALAACEEHPYPSSAPGEATAAARPDDAALAGAPAGPGGGYQAGPTTRSPTLYPPAGPPPYPMQGYAQGGDPSRAPYGPPARSYPPGYGRGYANAAPPEIITMAPIPNPPERSDRYGPQRGFHRHHHYVRQAYASGYRRVRHHRLHHRRAAYGAAHRAMTRAPLAHPQAAAPLPRRPAHPVHAAARPVVPAARPQLTQPQALDHHHRHARGVNPAATAAASGAATASATGANTTGPESTSEADRYQALEHDLHDQFGDNARLSVPSHMDAGRTAAVTLTLPADFAQTVRTEAAKQNLSQQAMTVNLMASLSGDGYTIVPAEAQTLPLSLDAPTTFAWKVTPNGASRGALKASVRAAMGDGHDVVLGDKSTSSGSATGRIVGIGLLALIALVLLGWAAQRRRPVVTGATKPRASHTNGVA